MAVQKFLTIHYQIRRRCPDFRVPLFKTRKFRVGSLNRCSFSYPPIGWWKFFNSTRSNGNQRGCRYYEIVFDIYFQIYYDNLTDKDSPIRSDLPKLLFNRTTRSIGLNVINCISPVLNTWVHRTGCNDLSVS